MGGVGGSVSLLPIPSFVEKNAVEMSAESCPLHLGTVLCMCGCVTWAESVGSGEKVSARVGQIIQIDINYWKKGY